MSEIKRYEIDAVYEEEDTEGSYCKYADITPIIQRNADLETENSVQRLQIDHLEAELARLHEQEPYAYETYKGFLLHAGDPTVSNYSNPKPLYADPKPAQETPAGLVEWANVQPVRNSSGYQEGIDDSREFVREQLEKMKGKL